MPKKKRHLAVSLFSGAGGMDLGVINAGFEILACIELDPHCCETLRCAATREKRNTRIYEENIRSIDPIRLQQELGVIPGELDLLCGGSPCQAFSQIGKRAALNDDRGMMLFEIVRFAKILLPKVILIEQVKGLLNIADDKGKKGGVFDELITELRLLGYQPKWKIINSADYGVPQLRQRVFIVATYGTNGFEFPAPTHAPLDKASGLFALTPYITVGEALNNLGEPDTLEHFQVSNSHFDITPPGDRKRINGVSEGSHLARELHLPKSQRGGLTKKDTTKYRRLSRTELSNTLRCGEIFFHPTENRYLTPREYLRIHGYPDSYYLRGPIRSRSGRVRNLDQHRQVANSVPPPVAFHLAKQILTLLSCQKSLKFTATH